MNPLVIVLGVILVVIILMSLFSSFFSGSSTLVANKNLMDGLEAIAADNLPASTSRTYGVWVYMNAWDGTKNKMIFGREKDIVLFLDKTSAKLKCMINPTVTNINGSVDTRADGGNASATNAKIVDITNDFPIQKWVFITIVIDSGSNVVDYYLDGKLVKSVKVASDDVTANPTEGLKFGSGHDTYIAQFKRTTKAVGPQDVWNMYSSGNPGSSLSSAVGNYNVNMSILKDNAVSSSLSLF